MEKIEKTLRYNSLYFVYQNLLTAKQKKIFEMYFIYDLSFSEIASELFITRSAVEDTLKKVCFKLDEYENKLQIIKTHNKIQDIIAKSNLSNDEKLKEIKELVENGI